MKWDIGRKGGKVRKGSGPIFFDRILPPIFVYLRFVYMLPKSHEYVNHFPSPRPKISIRQTRCVNRVKRGVQLGT